MTKIVRKITSKQLKFIERYAFKGDGALAAEQAGYAPGSAKQTAHRLLNTTPILRYMDWYFNLIINAPLVPPKYDLIKDLTMLGVRKIGMTPMTKYIDDAKAKNNLTHSWLDYDLIRASHMPDSVKSVRRFLK